MKTPELRASRRAVMSCETSKHERCVAQAECSTVQYAPSCQTMFSPQSPFVRLAGLPSFWISPSRRSEKEVLGPFTEYATTRDAPRWSNAITAETVREPAAHLHTSTLPTGTSISAGRTHAIRTP
jgi:hypothetical protein